MMMMDRLQDFDETPSAGETAVAQRPMTFRSNPRDAWNLRVVAVGLAL
jgi:hypothetical protein